MEDLHYLTIGAIGAAVNGGSIPLFQVLFGIMMDALNKNESLLSAVHELCLFIVYIAVGNFVGAFLQVFLTQIPPNYFD